jgi:hypothetical protein
MIQIRRVLCPIDFSPVSSAALEHAAALAQWYGAALHARHVFSAAARARADLPAVRRACARRGGESRSGRSPSPDGHGCGHASRCAPPHRPARRRDHQWDRTGRQSCRARGRVSGADGAGKAAAGACASPLRRGRMKTLEAHDGNSEGQDALRTQLGDVDRDRSSAAGDRRGSGALHAVRR